MKNICMCIKGKDNNFIVALFFIFTFLTIFSLKSFAEGSVDFVDYSGYRLFYYASRSQQLKVYANEGEFINVGASHIGIAGGYIEVYRPDGTLFSKFDNTAGTQGLGIINNYIEELNGPTGGGGNNGLGYIPGVVEVPQGEAGVWTILMRYPLPNSETNFKNVLNNEHWYRVTDQPLNKRVILAWDVTISKNNAGNMGGELVTGRLYSNELLSIISKNGFTTSPKYYIYTKDGIEYSVQYNDVDPWGFPIYSNSWGIVTPDSKPLYESAFITSVRRSDDPLSWSGNSNYLYDPQGPDFGNLLNNKVFINHPDPNMPEEAMVTDVLASNPITYTTWLYKNPVTNDVDFTVDKWISINPLAQPIDNAVNIDFGGYLLVNSSVEGTVRLGIDLNNDGDFDDPEDVFIYDRIHIGNDSIFWDAKDGLGNKLPEDASVNIAYKVRLTSGEIHILMDDIENDYGGVEITRLNGLNAPNNTFYFDHSSIGGNISGGGSSPLATSQAFTFNNSWGNEKILDYWTFSGVSIKDDVQVIDIYSGPVPTFIDSDKDGVVDHLDLDDDNDGIPDVFEYCNNDFSCLPGGKDPSHDEDNDGIQNYQDANDPDLDFICSDLNNDGICDVILNIFDTDNDQIPNFLDLDSDNDGISDLHEAGHQQVDSNNDGIIDGFNVEFGQNGLFNLIATNSDDLAAIANYIVGDSDNDGILNFLDLDSDNDGIHDVVEGGNALEDADNNGRLNANVNINGQILNLDSTIVSTSISVDTDGDGISNFLDLDSDNDGIHDVIEGGNSLVDSNDDGRLDGNSNGNGQVVSSDNFILSTSALSDHDRDGISNFLDLDSDNDGIHDVIEGGNSLVDSNDDGRLNGTTNGNGQVISVDNSILSSSSLSDNDGDGVSNFLDLDSDNDGIHDVIEGGNALIDSNDDGQLDGNSNMDGQIMDLDNTILSSSLTSDQDQDGISNFLDLDSDNDGIHDVIEGGNSFLDSNDDGRLDGNVNGNGQIVLLDDVLSTSSTGDHDGDGIANFLDLDSDNDGIHDVIEGGNMDVDGNGTLDQQNVNDSGQILVDGLAISTSILLDTDVDNVPDFLDLDSDNDGIHDVIEGGYEDEDGDGHIGNGIQDVNDNGQAILNGEIISNGMPKDTDHDGIYDFRDLDSDNDGIHDIIEGGNEDFNNDGVVGGAVDNDGNPLEANQESPPDSDNDGLPDSMELDSDDDGLSDENECPGGFPCRDLDGDGKKDFQDADRDGDGIEDQYECPNGDLEACLNTDGLDAPDIDDLDSDNDGISDKMECPSGYECPDKDEDGTPNYRDTDSDGDGLTDKEECPDGINCPDDDGDGIPNYLDSDCAFDIEIPVLTVNQPVCEGEDILLNLEDPGAIDNAFPNMEIVYIWRNGNGDLLPVFTSEQHVLNTNGAKAIGPFTVQAYVGNCPSDVSDPLSVDIIPKVVADIAVTDTAVCLGSDILLDAVLVNDATYTWTNLSNNSVISTDKSFLLGNIDSITNIQLTMQITGCVNTDSDEISIDLHPNPVIENISEDDLFCEGENVSLSASLSSVSLEPVDYMWTGPNNFIFSGTTQGTFDVSINNVQTQQGGNYQLQVVSDVGCVSEKDSVFISVQPLTNPSLLADETDLCEGSNLVLSTDLVIGNVTYKWFQDGVEFENTLVPTLTIDSPTIGAYTVMVESSKCVSAISSDVNINIINSNFETEIQNTAIETSPICEGENIQLSIIDPNPEILYSWYNSNNDFITSGVVLNLNDVHLNDEGQYYVKGLINNCAIPDVSTEVFVVNQPNISPVISSNIQEICAGLDLILSVDNNIDIDPNEITEYVWYLNGIELERTSDSNLSLTNVSNTQAGTYSVLISTSGCMGDVSNDIGISIYEVPSDLVAIVGEDNRICNENSYELSAQELVAGSGYWTALNGGIIENLSNITTTVSDLTEGTYQFVWTVDFEACLSYDSDTLTLIVGEADEVAQTGDDEVVCITDNDVFLNATIPNVGSGQWIQTGGEIVTIVNPDQPITQIDGFVAGNYAFNWVLSDGNCIDYSIDSMLVSITDIPNETAFIYEDYFEACSPNQIIISAKLPLESQGEWEVLGQGEVSAPFEAGSIVSGLDYGENTLIWKLEDEICGAFSNDTMLIKVFNEVVAEDDEFSILIDEELEENIIENDFSGNVDVLDFSIYDLPEHGTVSMASDGSFLYVPTEGFFGEDEFTYSITNIVCGQQDLAKVKILIKEEIDPDHCKIPNMITPNGDFSNDFLVIDCAPIFPENHLVIFNRWGDKIFEASPYLNDWRGTLKSNKLPLGTYFYIFKKSNDDTKPQTGYISILR